MAQATQSSKPDPIHMSREVQPKEPSSSNTLPPPLPPTPPTFLGIPSVGLMRFLSFFSSVAAQHVKAYDELNLNYQQQLLEYRKQQPAQAAPQAAEKTVSSNRGSIPHMEQVRIPQPTPQVQQYAHNRPEPQAAVINNRTGKPQAPRVQTPQPAPAQAQAQPTPKTQAPQPVRKAVTLDQVVKSVPKAPPKARPLTPQEIKEIKELQQLSKEVTGKLATQLDSLYKEANYERVYGSFIQEGKTLSEAKSLSEAVFDPRNAPMKTFEPSKLVGVLYGKGYSLEEILDPVKRTKLTPEVIQEAGQLIQDAKTDPARKAELQKVMRESTLRILKEGPVEMNHQGPLTETAKNYEQVFLRSQVLNVSNGMAGRPGSRFEYEAARGMSLHYQQVDSRFYYMQPYNDPTSVIPEFRSNDYRAEGLQKLTMGKMHAVQYGGQLNLATGQSFSITAKQVDLYNAANGQGLGKTSDPQFAKVYENIVQGAPWAKSTRDKLKDALLPPPATLYQGASQPSGQFVFQGKDSSKVTLTHQSFTITSDKTPKAPQHTPPSIGGKAMG